MSANDVNGNLEQFYKVWTDHLKRPRSKKDALNVELAVRAVVEDMLRRCTELHRVIDRNEADMRTARMLALEYGEKLSYNALGGDPQSWRTIHGGSR